METKLVSIITSTYNRAKQLERAIKSMKAQTYSNWEMIIVDDCSPDDGATAKTRASNTSASLKITARTPVRKIKASFHQRVSLLVIWMMTASSLLDISHGWSKRLRSLTLMLPIAICGSLILKETEWMASRWTLMPSFC